MKKMINSVNLSGYIYESNLELKTVKNETSANYGKEFIGGELKIAIDEDLLNVVPVRFSYVTEFTSTGKENATYAALSRIINEKKSVLDVGKDDALKVKINSALGLNDFYNQNNELVSSKGVEGGFVTIVTDIGAPETRDKFTCDMVITNVTRTEADEEKKIDKDFVTVKGVVFNFRNEILPVDFKVVNEQGMQYFEDLEASASNPIFTKVWGKINCNTIKTEIKEETAFGEAAVKTFEKKVKDWVLTGCQPESYDFGDENVLTPDELKKCIEDRNVHLADVKKRADDYKASKTATTTITNNSTDTFTF